MKKTVKIWLLLASALFTLGACIFCLSACSVGWDFSQLGTQKFETNIHEIIEEFTDISISVDTADVHILPSEDGERKVARLLFTLAAKDPNEHLDNIQQLMQVFTNEPLLDALMEANTPEDILAAEQKYPPEEDL